MRSDGRENIKKLWSFTSIVVPSKDKAYLNGYSDFEESLFWKDSKSICRNNNNKSDYNKMTKLNNGNSSSNNSDNDNRNT